MIAKHPRVQLVAAGHVHPFDPELMFADVGDDLPGAEPRWITTFGHLREPSFRSSRPHLPYTWSFW